ncbi:MAG: DUF58 domain-containing protein [Sulfurospirillaceae bacterium]|nr:DUF58 domain-containing protein [Sulfurospirillaceae bacterium]
MVGSNASKKEGDGYDFAQIRPYMYGENVKRIDWKQSAKNGEIQVRSFFEEKEIHLHVLGLIDGNLHFGIERSKLEVMSEIVALLGLSAIKNSDFFALSLLSDALLYQSHASKKEAMVHEAILKTLQAPLLGQKINWHFVQEFALYHIKKPSLLFIIGDFFEMPKLGAMARKHEVIVIRVRDHFEEKPWSLGALHVKDPITLKEDKVVLDDAFVKRYTAKRKEHDIAIESYLKKEGIKTITIYTNEDPFVKLFTTLGAM